MEKKLEAIQNWFYQLWLVIKNVNVKLEPSHLF